MTNVQIDLKDIEKEAKNFSSVEEVKKALRSVQSQKSRLIKQKSKQNYESEFAKIVLKEQLLKEVRSYLEPKKVTVTTMSQEDINKLSYDDTIRAIKSIQSKKCLEQFNSDQSEYNKALVIEQMLLQHKQEIKPLDEYTIKKSSVNDLIHNLENLDTNVNKDYILEQLKNLIQD
jgi:hypothetical protein